MGKPLNGPDWTDVVSYQAALESLHGCSISIIVTTAGYSGCEYCNVDVMACRASEAWVSGRPVLGARSHYPHIGWRSLEGLCLFLLHELERVILTTWWKQAELPLESEPAPQEPAA